MFHDFPPNHVAVWPGHQPGHPWDRPGHQAEPDLVCLVSDDSDFRRGRPDGRPSEHSEFPAMYCTLPWRGKRTRKDEELVRVHFRVPGSVLSVDYVFHVAA